jgi:hypothetical protein
MSKVNFNEDNCFKCMRRILSKLGISAPASNEDILTLSQLRRIEHGIIMAFEDAPTDTSNKHNKQNTG